MIKIRKTDGGDVFDLPPDYVIEAEKNNPMFSNKGSQTVPVNFPTTDKNNRLLNFPFRIDRSERQEGTIGVIVETGSVQQKGLLSVNSASNKIISANIGYDESAMYSVMKDMQLRDMPILNDPKFLINFGGNNTNAKVDSMLAHLTAVMKQETEADYYIFPVIVKKEDYTTDVINSDGTTTTDVNKTYLEIINEVDAQITDINNLPNGKIAELKALQNRIITRYENSQEIQLSAPKGYGVSPFLKTYRILEIIFENFGFTIADNPFKEHRQLKKLVEFNNTIDAVLTGNLNYKDLMPDCSIQEFLDALYAKFGMQWYADSNSKTIRIRLLKDIVNPLDESGSVDLNHMKTEEPAIAFSSPKQLRLKMNRQLDDAAVPFDTMEEFLDRFENQFTDAGIVWPNNITQIFRTLDSTYQILNLFTSTLSPEVNKSSDFFDWDKKTENVDYEDVEMKDMCLPLYLYGYSLSMQMLLYLVGFKHQYSDVFIGSSKQEIAGDQAKIAFAFAWGLLANNRGSTLFRSFFASQFNRDNDGNFMNDAQGIKYDISLTCNREDGLYNRFWKEYDAFIRHSNQQLTCNLHVSEGDFISFKMDDKMFINNQPVIAEQIKYKFNDLHDQISESKFRTLRLFKPFNLETEQKISKYVPQKYYWAWTSESSDEIPSNSIFIKRYFDSFFTVNGVQIPVSYMSNLPPTEEQFINQETRIFKITDRYFVPIYFTSVVTTITFKPALVT